MLIKRNLKLFFRDKAGVFFSLLAVFIIIGLYALFLRSMMENALENALGFYSDRIGITMSSLILGGMVAVTSITSCLGAIGISIADKERVTKDFITSPISRKKITFSYIVSSGIVGFIMTTIALILCIAYIVSIGGNMPNITDWGLLMLTVVLSVLCANAMVFFIATFIKGQSAFAAFSTVIGTLIGFIMGIYIPIAQLPDAIQWVIKLFPLSHSASMFRQIMADDELTQLFAYAPPEALESFREFFGVVFVYGNFISSFWLSAMILAVTTVLFYGLSLAVIVKRKY